MNAVRLDAAAATHVGRVRKLNEDSYLLSETGLAVVADGMGGHACGDVASALAVDEFRLLTERQRPTPDAIVDTVRAANERILDEAAANPEKAGMGTTVTGLAVVEQGGVPHWFIFNVGDSRTYRYAGGELAQLTVDHTEVGDLIAAGTLTEEQAKGHPLRHVVTRALGSEPAEPDTWLLPTDGAEDFVLCSDGLPNELGDRQIANVLAGTSTAQEAADALVLAAVQAGGRDNVTVIVLRSRDEAYDVADTATIPRSELLRGER